MLITRCSEKFTLIYWTTSRRKRVIGKLLCASSLTCRATLYRTISVGHKGKQANNWEEGAICLDLDTSEPLEDGFGWLFERWYSCGCNDGFCMCFQKLSKTGRQIASPSTHWFQPVKSGLVEPTHCDSPVGERWLWLLDLMFFTHASCRSRMCFTWTLGRNGVHVHTWNILWWFAKNTITRLNLCFKRIGWFAPTSYRNLIEFRVFCEVSHVGSGSARSGWLPKNGRRTFLGRDFSKKKCQVMRGQFFSKWMISQSN